MHAAVCPSRPDDLAALPAIAYERQPGAASRPLPAGYRRRVPEQTALYAVVREHLETLLADARERSASGAGYPRFVEREFRRYLSCGQLSRGFARLRCPECGFERLVAFSCKGRLCPSCWARRAGDCAAHLVDRVLPEARYRQFVLTFPWRLRFLLAVDRAFLTEMLRVFVRTLFAWQRLRGRRLGMDDGQTGSVTFVQRFGGALNAHPHLHVLAPDGLFVPGPGAGLVFAPLKPPTAEEFSQLATRVACRLGAIGLRRLAEAEQQVLWADDDQDVVHASAAEALRPLLRATGGEPEVRASQSRPLCLKVNGFSLHAARVIQADDRAGLERLCRYGLRAPFATERFSRRPDGRVCYRLSKPWPGPDGKTELVLEPLALMRRLAALIPAPYQNLVRYHGVFANRSRFRPLLPPPPVATAPPATPEHAGHPETTVAEPQHGPPEGSGEDSAAASGEPAQASPPLPPAPPAAEPDDSLTESLRPRRLAWSQLLRRVLHVDGLTCPRCATALVVLAFITDPAVVRKILAHLHLPTAPPKPEPASKLHDELFDVVDEPSDAVDRGGSRGTSARTPTARAPP